MKAQLLELEPTLLNLAQIAAVKAALAQLKAKFDGLGLGAQPKLSALLEQATKAIPNERGELSAFGKVLGHLYELQQALMATPLSERDLDTVQSIVLGAISQVRQLLSYRPDVGAILDDLTAVKRLSGGPADATAFHDFNVLQMAFRDVWMHAFDDDLKISAQELYEQAARLYRRRRSHPTGPREPRRHRQFDVVHSRTPEFAQRLKRPDTSGHPQRR